MAGSIHLRGLRFDFTTVESGLSEHRRKLAVVTKIAKVSIWV